MSSSRCSSPPPENVIRLEDLIKKCPGAPKRSKKKKKRPRGEDGSDTGSGTTIIGFDPIRSDGRGGEAGGDVGGGEDERTPPECPVAIRPQRLFHEDNDACMELSSILDFSEPARAAPQDVAEGMRER